MIRMEAAGQQPATVTQCWIPNNTQNAGVRSEAKPNIQIQYTPVPAVQNMYNAPCSIYNTPVITLPPSTSQTYIIDPGQQPQQPTQQLQVFQQQPQQQPQQVTAAPVTSNKPTQLRCTHFRTCKFYTENLQSLKNHELLHFSSGANNATNNTSVLPGVTHHCSDCNITFASKSAKADHDRRKHRTWPKIYTCSYCNFETRELDDFSEHNVQFHLDTGSSDQIYQCNQCTYSTSWKCFMDSHMLIHNITQLDYVRNTKKVKYEYGNTTGSGEQKPVSSITSSTPAATSSTVVAAATTPMKSVASTMAGTSSNGRTATTKHNTVTSVQHILPHKHPRHQHGGGSMVVQQQPKPQHTPQQQQQFYSHPPSTLANIAPMPQNTILTTLHPITTALNHTPGVGGTGSGGTGSAGVYQVKAAALPPQQARGPQQQQEFRCNLCHHFITTCSNTLHEHIKSHNTCQQCGYQTNNITDLSLHVCHYNDNTYAGNPLVGTDQWATAGTTANGVTTAGVTTTQRSGGVFAVASQPYNTIASVPALNPGVQPGAVDMGQQGGAVAAVFGSSNTRKRQNRQIMDDDFEQNLYRCHKCSYSTSWKCFLDSHMLTHVGI